MNKCTVLMDNLYNFPSSIIHLDLLNISNLFLEGYEMYWEKGKLFGIMWPDLIVNALHSPFC